MNNTNISIDHFSLISHLPKAFFVLKTNMFIIFPLRHKYGKYQYFKSKDSEISFNYDVPDETLLFKRVDPNTLDFTSNLKLLIDNECDSLAIIPIPELAFDSDERKTFTVGSYDRVQRSELHSIKTNNENLNQYDEFRYHDIFPGETFYLTFSNKTDYGWEKYLICTIDKHQSFDEWMEIEGIRDEWEHVLDDNVINQLEDKLGVDDKRKVISINKNIKRNELKCTILYE